MKTHKDMGRKNKAKRGEENEERMERSQKNETKSFITDGQVSGGEGGKVREYSCAKRG